MPGPVPEPVLFALCARTTVPSVPTELEFEPAVMSTLEDEMAITPFCTPELEEGTRVALCLRLLPVAKSRTFGSNFDTLVDMDGSCACGEPGFDIKTLPVDRLICSKRRILR